MRQVATALIAITCLALLGVGAAHAQTPYTASVGFRNRTDMPIIVQGCTIVNGVQLRGQTLKIMPQGGMAFESNVPNGVRYYTIYHASQPSRVLLRDCSVLIQSRDLTFSVEPSPTHPGLVLMRPIVVPLP